MENQQNSINPELLILVQKLSIKKIQSDLINIGIDYFEKANLSSKEASEYAFEAKVLLEFLERSKSWDGNEIEIKKQMIHLKSYVDLNERKKDLCLMIFELFDHRNPDQIIEYVMTINSIFKFLEKTNEILESEQTKILS